MGLYHYTDGISLMKGTVKTMAEVTIGSPSRVARNLVDQGMDAEHATALGWILHDLDARANSLNVIDIDLTPVADEIDLVIAKLTKAAEKIKK